MAKGPTLRRRRLGSELRRLREAAGLTLQEAGALIYGSDSKVSRLENGKGALKLLEIGVLLDRYGATKAEKEKLLAVAQEADQPEPWSGLTVPAGLETLLGLEAEAARLEVYSASIMYGLLQTESYARATVRAGFFADPDAPAVDERVELRLRRQSILDAESSPELVGVIDEAVLRRPVGSSPVMIEQIHHLLELGDRQHISLHVLPFSAGAHAGQTGSFVHLSFPGESDPDLIYCDGPAGNLYLEKPESVRSLVEVFRHLRDHHALNEPDSKRFLESLAKEYR